VTERYAEAERVGINVAATRRALHISLLIILIPTLALILYFKYQNRTAPSLTVSSSQLVLSAAGRRVVSRRDVVSVRLESAWPAALADAARATQGDELKRELALNDGRRAMVFATLGAPPFVVITTQRGLVVFNAADPARTTAMYREIARAWPDLV